MPEDHRHYVEGKVSEALQAGWCRCGWVWDMKRERWTPPKYTEGLVRAANWKGDPDAA